MEKQTNIYRFGTWITSVPDNKESLRKWIIDNCPYDNVDMRLAPTTSVSEAVRVAKRYGYTFEKVQP